MLYFSSAFYSLKWFNMWFFFSFFRWITSLTWGCCKTKLALCRIEFKTFERYSWPLEKLVWTVCSGCGYKLFFPVLSLCFQGNGLFKCKTLLGIGLFQACSYSSGLWRWRPWWVQWHHALQPPPRSCQRLTSGRGPPWTSCHPRCLSWSY